jgi:hypothetical protein
MDENLSSLPTTLSPLSGGDDADFQDYIGHLAITDYFGASECKDGKHKESWKKVNPAIVEDANAGRMRKMMRAFDKKMLSIHYTPEGVCDMLNGKKYKYIDPTGPSKFKTGDKLVIYREHIAHRNWNAHMPAYVKKGIYTVCATAHDAYEPGVRFFENSWIWEDSSLRLATKKEIAEGRYISRVRRGK